MPKKAHQALERGARRKGLKGKARQRYIYGALANIEKRKRRVKDKRKKR